MMRPVLMLGVVLALLVPGCGGSTPPAAAPLPVAGLPAPSKEPDESEAEIIDDLPTPLAEGPYALLVACTTYDHLTNADLRGPENDVSLLSDLLTRQYEFPEANLVVLSESAGGRASRPLRRNIEREFRKMADRAHDGDQIVVYLSGHGAQQPDDATDPKDLEPDGLDEVFCAADTKPGYDFDNRTVPNVIRDDDLREWIGAIRRKGASVWVIVDSCHSGTGVRGSEVLRQIPMERLITESELTKARQALPPFQGRAPELVPVDTEATTEGMGGLVATYAAQPHEPTPEVELPLHEPGSRMQGLFTYMLVKVLTVSQGKLTYSELIQRVHAEYVALGLVGPVPLVEGSDRNKEVLGTRDRRAPSPLVLQTAESGFKVNAGKLQGLTRGSVLAVHPLPGKGDAATVLGHVRITQARLNDAFVEPCEYADAAEVRDLPRSAPCEIVFIDHGDLRLRVGVDNRDGHAPPETVQSLTAMLEELSAAPNAVLQFVDDLSQADWLVQGTEGGQVLLVPAQGWPARFQQGSPAYGPVPSDAQARDWLKDRLPRIARARNLLRMSGGDSPLARLGAALLGRTDRVGLKVEMLKLEGPESTEGEPVEWTKDGVALRAGDHVSVRVTNAGLGTVDFTLLFIDSGYGITVLFPPADTVADNRLPPDASTLVGPLKVEGTSFGLEHIVAIGTKAAGQPASFGWLSQDSVERARSLSVGLPGQSALDSPTGRLFQSALFGGSQSRGLSVVDADAVSLSVLSWHTVGE